jgi:hypothetical protein
VTSSRIPPETAQTQMHFRLLLLLALAAPLLSCRPAAEDGAWADQLGEDPGRLQVLIIAPPSYATLRPGDLAVPAARLNASGSRLLTSVSLAREALRRAPNVRNLFLAVEFGGERRDPPVPSPGAYVHQPGGADWPEVLEEWSVRLAAEHGEWLAGAILDGPDAARETAAALAELAEAVSARDGWLILYTQPLHPGYRDRAPPDLASETVFTVGPALEGIPRVAWFDLSADPDFDIRPEWFSAPDRLSADGAAAFSARLRAHAEHRFLSPEAFPPCGVTGQDGQAASGGSAVGAHAVPSGGT